MKHNQRHIKKYKPRRRRADKGLQKEQLKDFEHLLEMDLSIYLILSKKGTSKQVEKAKGKISSDLMKYGCELEAIGRDLGLGFPKLIQDYIKSMSKIVEHPSIEVDPSLIDLHKRRAEELRKHAA